MAEVFNIPRPTGRQMPDEIVLNGVRYVRVSFMLGSVGVLLFLILTFVASIWLHA